MDGLQDRLTLGCLSPQGDRHPLTSRRLPGACPRGDRHPPPTTPTDAPLHTLLHETGIRGQIEPAMRRSRVVAGRRIHAALVQHPSAIAGPWVLFRPVHDACAYGIQFDVSAALPEIFFRSDNRRVVPGLPQRTGQAMPVIEPPAGSARQLAHDLRQRTAVMQRGKQQVDMIGHQAPCVDCHLQTSPLPLQVVQIGQAIGFISEYRLAAMRTLDNMVRMALQHNAGSSRHDALLDRSRASGYRARACRRMATRSLCPTESRARHAQLVPVPNAPLRGACPRRGTGSHTPPRRRYTVITRMT
ncbi:hypothetical protein L494_0388 [Bordetella bronchiseptica CA90 BB1334]|nr:hypothetical protein L494_0388 [Bordetella bronchiseptica CA90 BB1334]KDD44151.1 hypothetical protein L532_0345 [Bordetella bronchiseptica OSU095]